MYHDWGSRAGKWNGGTGGGMVQSRSGTRAATLGLVGEERRREESIASFALFRLDRYTAAPSAGLRASSYPSCDSALHTPAIHERNEPRRRPSLPRFVPPHHLRRPPSETS